MQKLTKDFYMRADVALIAKELIGKVIVTKFDGKLATARIVETEAYAGIVDRASHAYGGRRTNRTEVMFGKPGVAYVYLCYGIHKMFNIVTNDVNVPDAVLIRGVEPIKGKEIMQQRLSKKQIDASVGRGPGNAAKALGIDLQHTGSSLLGEEFFIAANEFTTDAIMVSKRIGIDYAGDHAAWLYRFFVKDHPNVTKHSFNKESILLL